MTEAEHLSGDEIRRRFEAWKTQPQKAPA
jgi:hypothetical protein